jgi:lipopolysaccharide/colanic/teichoic acid biosynthesis glycosyltransferase
VKRFFDLFLSVLLAVFLSPFAGLIAAMILVRMGRPVLFVQMRPGFQGRPFSVYKFRTMKEARNAAGQPSPDRERLTSLGKFLRKCSLDEIPQLYNVIRGDISFVGPRPLLVEYLPRYTPEQARRHDVKPGITGWAQVNGRNAISWEEKFRLDVWYVEHQGFFLDMKILWLTIIKVLKKEGINADGSATMPEFMGSATDDGKQ